MRVLLGTISLLLFVCASSCESQCDACQVPPCPEVVPTVCPYADGIHLDDLDSDELEALKDAVRDEVKDEVKRAYKEEWTTEFEETQKAEMLEALKAELKPKVPNAKPANLPPTQKVERDPGGMKILRQVFTTKIIRRLPQDDREAFSISDATVNCFVEIMSASEEERMITIRFTHSTGLTQSYSLPVGQSPAWRTWSKLNLTRSMTGTWLCEVFNEEGILLASRPFIVVE